MKNNNSRDRVFNSKNQTFTWKTLAHFSKKVEYQLMNIDELWRHDPEYLVWIYKNLKYVKFDDDISKVINSYETNKEKRGINKVAYFK